jgi:hypothetical protein
MIFIGPTVRQTAAAACNGGTPALRSRGVSDFGFVAPQQVALGDDGRRVESPRRRRGDRPLRSKYPRRRYQAGRGAGVDAVRRILRFTR